MSLVGTRPPTVDEWEQYELHHRSRMSTKPGITGMHGLKQRDGKFIVRIFGVNDNPKGYRFLHTIVYMFSHWSGIARYGQTTVLLFLLYS